MAREARKRNVVQDHLKSSDGDLDLVTMNLKVRKFEKVELDALVKRLNQERPETKITLVLAIRKGIKLLNKELEKKSFERI